MESYTPLYRLTVHGGVEGFAGSVLDLLIDNGARMDLEAFTDSGRCVLADMFTWSPTRPETIVNRLVNANTKIPHPVPSWLVKSATALQKLREYKLTCENGHRCNMHRTCVPTNSDRDCMLLSDSEDDDDSSSYDSDDSDGLPPWERPLPFPYGSRDYIAWIKTTKWGRKNKDAHQCSFREPWQ